jgi:hypothetical protein
MSKPKLADLIEFSLLFLDVELKDYHIAYIMRLLEAAG